MHSWLEHVGSTSVAELPAKPIIDVDLIAANPADEDAYVPAMEKAGFQFLFREPAWYEHRFFGLDEPYANIHIFGPDAPEVKRHVLFRDWLRENEHDRHKYAEIKGKPRRPARQLASPSWSTTPASRTCCTRSWGGSSRLMGWFSTMARKRQVESALAASPVSPGSGIAFVYIKSLPDLLRHLEEVTRSIEEGGGGGVSVEF